MTQVETWVEEGEWDKVRKGIGRLRSKGTMEDILCQALARKPEPPLDIVKTLIAKLSSEGDGRFLRFDGDRDGFGCSKRSWLMNSFFYHSLDIQRLVMPHVHFETYYFSYDRGFSDALRATWRRFLKIKPDDDTPIRSRDWDGIDGGRAAELASITSLDDASGELKEAWERTMLIVGLADRKEKDCHARYVYGKRRMEQNLDTDSDEESTCKLSDEDIGWTKPPKERLLHHLVKCNAPSVLIWFALRLFPEQTLKRDYFGRLPLHYAIEQFHMPDPLTETEHNHFPEACAFTLLLNTKPSAAAHHNTKGETPLYCLVEVLTKKESSFGSFWMLKWITELIRAEPRSLITPDVTTHLLPFMLLASCMGEGKVDERKGGREVEKLGSYYPPRRTLRPYRYASRPDPKFDMLYRLIRENPDALKIGIKRTAYEEYLEARVQRLEAQLANMDLEGGGGGGGEVGSKRSRSS